MSTSLYLKKIHENTGDSPPVATGWYMLAVLSLLMGFASISTDLYLPVMPEMSRSLHADAGMIELTISGYLIGFSLGQLLWGASVTDMAAVRQWRSVWSCS